MSSPSPADAPIPSGVPHPALVVRTIAVPAARVADLLSLLPEPDDAGDVVSWVRKGEGFVGWGRVATFRASGPDRFDRAQEWWRQDTAEAIVRDDVDEPGTGPIAFGSMAYSRRSQTESVLVVPEVVVGRRGSLAWVTTITTDATVPAVPRVTPSAGGTGVIRGGYRETCRKHDRRVVETRGRHSRSGPPEGVRT